MSKKIMKLTPIGNASPDDVLDALSGIPGIRRARVVGKEVVVEPREELSEKAGESSQNI